MTPDEMDLTKEMIKESAKQMFAPVQDIVRQLFGPATTEVGLMFGDFAKAWRMRNVFRLFQGIKAAAQEHGFELKPVAPRLLFPIMESASLQDEEDLHERWIALLTNAARVDFDSEMLPCFPDILKQLTSDEARFLDRVYDEVLEDETQAAKVLYPHNQSDEDVRHAKHAIRETTLEFIPPIVIENLERLMLVSRIANIAFVSDVRQVTNTFSPSNHLYVSDFGRAFIRACRLPKK